MNTDKPCKIYAEVLESPRQLREILDDTMDRLRQRMAYLNFLNLKDRPWTR